MADLIDKAQRLADLGQRLKQSLLIESLWPGVFEDGGQVKSRVIGAGNRPTQSWQFEIERDGERRAWPLFETPLELWPQIAAWLAGDTSGRRTLARLQALPINAKESS